MSRLNDLQFRISPDHPSGQQGASELGLSMPWWHVNNDSFTFSRCHVVKFLGNDLMMGPLNEFWPHMLHET